MERTPHPDREKSHRWTQPIKMEAAFKAARLATTSGKDCDIQVSQLQSRGVCQLKTISKRDFSIVLTDEGEKSNRCESCVYPAAVFCNIMSIDLFFCSWVIGWMVHCSACQPGKLALTAACQVRISTQITQPVSQGTLGQRYSVMI